MIIAFFGHSEYLYDINDENKLLTILEEVVGDKSVDFYLGGYGNFDYFALNCCNAYKKTHANAKTIFVTPYLDSNYQKLKESALYYDESIYPPIEDTPKKFAIAKRNEWVAKQADIIIVYVSRHYGGAFSALQCAKQMEKPSINLYTEE